MRCRPSAALLRAVMLHLVLATLLAGCASTPPAPLNAVHSFASASAKLDVFAELTLHYRDTYQRERPYLQAEADATERASDAQRRAAYGDFLRIQKSVVRYLETLATLSGEQQYDFSARVKTAVSGIKAWPDSGIDTQHAAAYTRLGQLVTKAVTGARQKAAVNDLLRDGAQPLATLLAAMSDLLRYYQHTSDNEKALVLGLYEVEIPFRAAPQQRLLATLAKVNEQEKEAEFRATARRFTLAENNLRAISQAHRLLLQNLALPAADPALQGELARANLAIRDSVEALSGEGGQADDTDD